RGSADLPIWAVLDQDGTETCHAASEGQGVWVAREQIGRPLGFFPCIRLIASCVYADTQGPAGARGRLKDAGADLSDDATATATWGVGPYKGPTSDGRIYDVEGGLADFPEPDPTELVIAGADLIAGQYQVPIDDRAMVACCLALDAGIPIQPGGPVNDVYQGLSGPDAVATSATAPGGGGHARLWTGYRTIAPGVYQLKELNSWGTGWGNGGFVWVDASRVACEWMAFAMAVK
ncbi:MAG TPA: hypothetical protein VN894_01995, partial [Polyangiaceae bacterium]|nr:hypothetical protein [Polyangiaceae bacterium]